MMNISVDEVEQLIPYLYRLDARDAGARLIEIGSAAVDSLISVLEGSYPLPEVDPNTLTEIEEALLECAGIETPLNVEEARARAAHLLGAIGSTRAVPPLISAFGRERERPVMMAIVQALGEMSDRRALDILIGALCADTEFETLRTAIAAVGMIGDARGARALLALVREMVSLPAESWDEHGSNLITGDAGVTEHRVRTGFREATRMIRQIGDRATRAALDQILTDAPAYVNAAR